MTVDDRHVTNEKKAIRVNVDIILRVVALLKTDMRDDIDRGELVSEDIKVIVYILLCKPR